MKATGTKTVVKGLRLFAPAKINWVLTIERKRPDGYHDIHTVFQAISFGDELTCRPADEDACLIQCNDPAVPSGPDNLVARAWLRLRQAFPERVRGLTVQLDKRVPAGAGLGGGSSDAAATLVAVNRIYGLGLRTAQLEAHAAALGSDCAFFIRGGTAQADGRGERLTPLRGHLPRAAPGAGASRLPFLNRGSLRAHPPGPLGKRPRQRTGRRCHRTRRQ